MKILYDHQIFTQQKYGGISRYFFELIRRFGGGVNSCEVATLFSDNAYYNKVFNPQLNKILPTFDFIGKPKITRSLNFGKSIIKVKNGNFDVFHPTYYNDYFLKSIGNKPFVVTFYDMIHEKFGDQYSELSNDKQAFEFKKSVAQRANKIIAISKTTKNDIIEIYGIDEEKIDVVYLGNSLEMNIGDTYKFVDENYILFVGNRSIYKNFVGFVTAISSLLINNNLKLVCAGGGDFSPSEIDFIHKMGMKENIILIKNINDEILSNLYRNALFFVFPSLYEGFGIPVLESFASACPILLSNGGSLPEVGGDAALYFDPTDAHSIYTATDQLINDMALREALVQKGTTRLSKFSWDNTFKETLNVYESLV